MTAEPALPKVYRPLGARMVSAVCGIGLVGMLTFLWLMLPAHVRAEFGWAERFTLILVFVGIVSVLYGIFRTRVTASDRGICVRNGYRRHELYWAEVVSLSLTSHRPWALLDLDDGSTIAVMALQSADGPRATRSARELAAMIVSHSETTHNN